MRCRGVIGAHESMIMIRNDDETREATTPSQAASYNGECYHRDCYVRAYSQVRGESQP